MIVGASELRLNEPPGSIPGWASHSARWIAVWGRDPDLGRAARRVTRDLVGEVGESFLPLGWSVWATMGHHPVLVVQGRHPVLTVFEAGIPHRVWLAGIPLRLLGWTPLRRS